jgi:hypothetical protein
MNLIIPARTDAGTRSLKSCFELYILRGRANGHAVDDWLMAEAELRGHSLSDTNPGPTIRESCISSSVVVRGILGKSR